jgi:hypothetical protein
MTKREYAAALISSGWWTQLKMTTDQATRLAAWRQDSLFAPVAVMRIDPSNGDPSADPRQVRYLISQMNGVASSNANTWIDNQSQRRIHLFEARWIDPTRVYDRMKPTDGWGIIDADLNYFVYPNPLSSEWPNLPGWSYPLTQPLSFDQD